MRNDSRYPLLAVAAVLAATLAGFAQTSGSVPANEHSVSPSKPNDAPPRLNAPYTLTRTVASVQRLANGTTITRNMTIKEARDSSRRVYTETHRMVPNSDGQQEDSVVYGLSDPQARTHLQWNSNSTTAFLTHAHELITVHTPAPGEAQAHATETPKHIFEQPQVSREDLGTNTIAGLEAKGTRITRMIPVGQEGNDAPLTVTHEMWRSTEYGIIVLLVSDDPHSGIRTEAVTEFQQGEPDPVLFHAPKGYTVKEDVVDRPD